MKTISPLYLKIEEQAKATPHKIAIIDGHKKITFLELLRLIDKRATLLNQNSIMSETKSLMFLRPGFDFAITTFALFKIGATPIFIDPGMGKENLQKAIIEVRPLALFGIPLFYFLKSLKLISKETLQSVRYYFITGPKIFSYIFKAISLNKDPATSNSSYGGQSTPLIDPDQLGAILFTSGGTGPCKGVETTQNILKAQTETLQELFKLSSRETDYPGFPLFMLFTLCLGMTVVIPRFNPSRPSKCNPKKIIEDILLHKPTFLAGSPAIWERVADYAHKKKILLNSVKYLVMFGAPVPISLHEKLLPLIPGGDTYTPYGATEGLPVSCISGRTILQNTKEKTLTGAGTCVGKPAPGVQIKIIKSTTSALTFETMEELPRNSVGEIIVSSPCTTRSYYQRAKDVYYSKIWPSDQSTHMFWHRMGDLGYLDDAGQLWFCGRKAHQVEIGESTLYSIPCEAIFNRHPLIKRSALIQLPEKKAAMALEGAHLRKLKGSKRQQFLNEVKSLARKYPHTETIEAFYTFDQFPVDVRHNIKIDRNKLALWAINSKNSPTPVEKLS